MNKELPTLQELLERDALKIKELSKSREKSKIEPEWVLLAEFGLFFGWQAVVDARNDKISFQEMNKLLSAARRIESTNRYNRIIDNYVAIAAQYDKGKALKATLKEIKNTWQTQ